MSHKHPKRPSEFESAGDVVQLGKDYATGTELHDKATSPVKDSQKLQVGRNSFNE